MRDTGSILFIVMSVLIGIVILFNMFVSTGQITIEKSYYNELQECSAELAKQKPECPACKCEFGIAGLAWGVLGLLFYAGGILYFSWRSSELDKKEQRIPNYIPHKKKINRREKK